MGVVVILGITTIPFGCFGSDNTIFESVDGKYRFYVMPHREPLDKLNTGHADNNIKAYMWQLSFLVSDESKAIEYAALSGTEKLLNFISSELADWHHPVPQLIANTPLSLLMAMPIYDRGIYPCLPHEPINNGIFVIGDAAHPMSPFKGQGANQALLDAVALADFLVEYHSDVEIINLHADKKSLINNGPLAHFDDLVPYSDPTIRSISFNIKPLDQNLIDEACAKKNFTLDPILYEEFVDCAKERDKCSLNRKLLIRTCGSLKRPYEDCCNTNLDTDKIKYFYKKMLDRVAPKISKSRDRIQRYHSKSEVMSIESYCYGPYVTVDFINHLNNLSLNAFNRDHQEPLYEAVKRELQAWIIRHK